MSKLIIRGALANAGSEVKTDELLEFLMNETKDTEFYKLSPAPGIIMNTALDWQIILGSTASVITIAQIFWSAYKKFILPLKKKGKQNTFLFVTVENHKRDFAQFTIGRKYQSEEMFIQEFTEKVTKIRHKTDPEEMELKIRETSSSMTWKKYRK